MNCDLRIGSISDIHLGHHRTVTEHILANLSRDFSPLNPDFTNLDLIVIDGDVFDRQLTLGDPQSFEIKIWVNNFLRNCAQHDIVVRVLEGTPSHDWRQSKIFTSENELSAINCDVIYVTTLHIEYIPRFDIHILYVPDEWRPDPDTTWMEVKQLLLEHQLEQVDFALMHGTFEHQLPSHIRTHRHLNDRYSSIVKYFIFVGHIHLHSVLGKIIANGSYDRIAHGEEGPKGYVRVHVRLNGNHEILFVENTGALIYRTIDCRKLTLEEALLKISANVNYPVDSNLQIRANSQEPIINAIDTVRKKYPGFNWKIKVDSDSVVYADVQSNLKTTTHTLNITRENIVALVARRLELKKIDPVLMQRALVLLEGVIKHGPTGS